MGAVSFCAFEFVFISIFLGALFLYHIIRSVMLLGDLFTSNPLFEKRRTKYLEQWSMLTNSTSFIVLFYGFFSLFSHQSQCTDIGNSSSLPMLLLILYWFLRLSENFLKKWYPVSTVSQTVSSAGFFILLFVPFSVFIISADNLIDFFIPLELFGLLLYFIIVEYSYSNSFTNLSYKPQPKTIVKGLFYYFWLNFIGTLSLFLSIFILALISPSPEFKNLSFFLPNPPTPLNMANFFFLFLIIGLTVKAGGLFFFFFKIDIYKFLPVFAVLLFSLFISFFYFLIFFYLTLKLPSTLLWFKYEICGLLAALTVYLLFVANFEQRNVYVFAGLSTATTVSFCLLVLI